MLALVVSHHMECFSKDSCLDKNIKAQINANQRDINGLHQLSRTNLIVSYRADIRKNSTVSKS